MRREVFALVLCACGTNAPATSTFDSGVEEPPVVDRSPGADDAVDASAALGVACTPGSVRVIATAKYVFDGPRVDDGFVYWSGSDPEADADPTQGYWWGSGRMMAVFRAGKLGENPTRVFGTSSSIGNVESLLPFTAVDATSIYWIAYSAGDFGAIMRAAKDGSSPTALVSGLPTLRRLELAGPTLFFTSGTSLYSIDVDGTNEHVVTQAWSATEFAIGATHVYAIADGDVHGYTGATIVRVPRSGGAIETVVEQAPRIDYRGLSVGNDGFVYTMETVENGEWPANLLAVPAAEDKTPSIVVPGVQDDAIDQAHLFTTTDGSCVVYTTSAGVFRRCPSTVGATISAVGPGVALEPPVVDSTSVYWRVQIDATTSTIYAACKL